MSATRNPAWTRRTYVASGLAFVGTFGALGVQMRAGADPAVGALATTPPRAHVIVTTKVIRTQIVTRRIVQPAPAPAPAVAVQPSTSAYTPVVRSSAPVVRQSAPVVRQSAPVVRQAAPVRAAAPAAPKTRAS